MINKFTLANNHALSLTVSHEDYMVNFNVTDPSYGAWGTLVDRDMNLREMMWLLQVTPEMLRKIADETEMYLDFFNDI